MRINGVQANAAPGRGSFREVFRVFLKLGLTSFGGPVAHLGYFREEFVVKRKWVNEGQYAQLVALCQFLPGPASSQVGFAIGLTRAGYRGGLAAWLAFTLPSAAMLILFALGAVSLDGAGGQGLLLGLKAVAAGVVAHAVLGMARMLTPDSRRVLIAAASAGAALLIPGNLGQLGAILFGLAAGVLLCRALPAAAGGRLTVAVSRRAGIVALLLFAALLTGLPVVSGFTQGIWAGIADAFYRAGALVFGGGHVVLPLLQAEPAIASAVPSDQFLAGYGAAQAVPGPLFTFASFLGFEMVQGGAALFGALLALVAVFLPGMLLLLAALPFADALRENPPVRAAIAGANAAVVGILAAALWRPVITSGITGVAPLVIALGSFALLQLWKVPPWLVVIAGGAGGLLASLAGVSAGW